MAQHTATVDIMQPGSAMVILNRTVSAHVWGRTGSFNITFEGDEVATVRTYKEAVRWLAKDADLDGDIDVGSTNEITGKVTRYTVRV